MTELKRVAIRALDALHTWDARIERLRGELTKTGVLSVKGGTK